MNIKRRAIQIVLSDHKTIVTVKSPTMEQFSDYLDSFGVISQIGKAFQALEPLSGGVGGNLTKVKLDPQMLEDFYPLLALLSSYRETITPLADDADLSALNDQAYTDVSKPVSTDEYKSLPVADGMAIMLTYVKLLAPESMVNPTAAEPVAAVPQETPVPLN